MVNLRVVYELRHSEARGGTEMQNSQNTQSVQGTPVAAAAGDIAGLGNIAASAAAVMEREAGRPMEWLLIYSIERNGGIDDAWLERSGLNRKQAESIQRLFPKYVQEARNLLRLGRLFSLDTLFELLRESAVEMLGKATRPADIKSLLGTLRGLEQRSGSSGSSASGRSAAPGRPVAGPGGAPPLNELREQLAAEGLSRQQRRKLERMLGKLEQAGS